MVTQRVSTLQKRILRLLKAEHHRTQGGTSLSHHELVKTLGGYKAQNERTCHERKRDVVTN